MGANAADRAGREGGGGCKRLSWRFDISRGVVRWNMKRKACGAPAGARCRGVHMENPSSKLSGSTGRLVGASTLGSCLCAIAWIVLHGCTSMLMRLRYGPTARRSDGAAGVGILSDEIKLAALMHGLKQKIGDAAAIKCDPTTGKPADLATKRKNMQEIITRLQSGQWSVIGQGGGRTYGVLLEALYRMYQGRKTYEELGEFLKAKTKEQKAALEVDKRIAPFVMEVKAERAKEVDVEDLLADLED